MQEEVPQQAPHHGAAQAQHSARDADWGSVLVHKGSATGAAAAAGALVDWELLSQPSLASHRSCTPPPCAHHKTLPWKE